MRFSPDLRDRVANGTITVSYRLWSRPKVKVGGTYRSGPVAIKIDDLEQLPFSAITTDELARTGEPDLESLRQRAAHAGPVEADTLLYRVEFHVAQFGGWPPTSGVSPSVERSISLSALTTPTHPLTGGPSCAQRSVLHSYYSTR